MSGYRKKHSCQHILQNFVGNCKKHLYIHRLYGIITTDLSKAFDYLPYKLLISKLHAYGINDDACKLICNYFYSRKQRVKLGKVKSEWVDLVKGAPQGSLFGPFMFNVFQNDLLLKLQSICDLYNYADDNSAGCDGENVELVYEKLQNVMSQMLNWFNMNCLKANPSKFQLMLLHGKNLSTVIQTL